MPASGDLRSEDTLFFTTPSRNFNRPARQIDPTPNGNDLGHYMKSYRKDILSKFAIIVLMPEIIFVSKWIRAKMPHTDVLRMRKIHILSKKWAKSQTKAQKSSKNDFIREIWWPIRERGRSVPYLGELACMVLLAINVYKSCSNLLTIRLRPRSNVELFMRRT